MIGYFLVGALYASFQLARGWLQPGLKESRELVQKQLDLEKPGRSMYVMFTILNVLL